MSGIMKFVVFLVCVFANIFEAEDLEVTGVPSSAVYENVDSEKSSLVFVFDTTGSMYNDLKQLRDGAELILNTALEESDVIEDFVFVPFHDPAVGPATVTKDKETFKKALDAVRVYGGGDCPEKSLTGIQLALNVSRPRSFVYVFTDATAADHSDVGKVLDYVQRKQSQVVFVLTGHCNDLQRPSYKVYQQISAASSGQVFNLNKTSVHKVLDFVRNSIKGRTVNLGSAVNIAGYNHTQGIPVDNTLAEVTVSVSGAKPSIKVVDPSGEQLTGPPKLIKTLDLSEIMVVKVLQPEPGNWTITTGSEDAYSVKVVGLSNVTFSHGFSVQSPSSMADTMYRPLQGSYNHMLIHLTQTSHPVHISYAEIVSLEGRTLFEIPLHVFDDVNGIYVADPFVPPDEFFYIAINGRDEFNHELRRIGATAIQSKPPDLPYLSAPNQIEARPHERILLRCHIESLVPITAMWTKDYVKIQPQTSSSQTTTMDFVIEDMSEGDIGTYTCVAKNVAGISKAATEVALIVNPPLLKIYPKNKTIDLGDNISIQCEVKTEALLLSYQFGFNGTRDQYLIDILPSLETLMTGEKFKYEKVLRNVTEDDCGVYFCSARNRAGESQDSTLITIQSQPLVQILGPHSLAKQKNSELQLVCHVENAEKVIWIAPNGTVVREVQVSGSFNDMLDLYQLEYGGVWTCVAVRRNYRVSDSVNITILIKPEVLIEGDKNITVLNGTSYDITCIVTAKPEPRIIWHRETEAFLNHTVYVLKPDVYRSVLRLDSAKEPVNGTYFCFGENTEGIGQDSVAVNVRRNMQIVEGFSDQYKHLYDQLSLPCRIDAYPFPKITWYHNGTEIMNDDHNMYLSENKTSLNILRMDFDNFGSYVCIANNGYEEIRIEGFISVYGLEAPLVNKEARTFLAQKGQSVVLPCRILKGNPKPVLSWQFKKNGSRQFTDIFKNVTDDREFEITDVSEDFEGVYRCTAENVIGVDFVDFHLAVQYPPMINVPEKDTEIEVLEGQLVELPCSANGIPKPEIMWLQNGNLITSRDERRNIDDFGLRFVTNLTDFGEYTCVARNKYGNASLSYTILIWVPPTITAPLDTSLTVLSGTDVTLQCDAVGFPIPVVSWEFQRVPIVQNTTNLSYNEYGNLYIKNASSKHEGIYYCIAENVAGIAEKTIFLNINELPRIIEDNYTGPYIATSRDSVLLISCRATGNPTPSISWSREGHLLDQDTRYNIIADGTLAIKEPTEDVSGPYTCIAKNSVGEVNKTFTVQIFSLPERMQADETVTTLTVLEGTSLDIECPVHASATDIVKWYKDAKQISTGHLHLQNVSRNNESTYACVVSNLAASTHSTVQINVEWPPRFVGYLTENVEAVEGYDIFLDCEVDAKPIAKIKWYFHSRPLVGQDKQKLKLLNVQMRHTGVYKCIIFNPHGSIVRHFTLDVLVPPSISDFDVLDVQLIKGDNATLECNAQGSPTPEIRWTYNNTAWHIEHFTLATYNMSVESEGIFRCDATNKAGKTHIVYRVTVVIPARIFEVVMFKYGQSGETVENSLGVELNSQIRLSCKASGHPAPKIRWIRNGKQQSSNDQNIDYADLVIEKVQLGHNGFYTCVVSNEGGIDERRIKVEVLEPPKLFNNLFEPSSKEPVQMEVLSDQSFSLHCHPYGTPAPTLYWFRDGKTLRLYDDSMVFGDYGEVVSVDRARSDQSGNYTCVARSKIGEASLVYIVDVLVPPPTPKESSKFVSTRVGKPLRLSCPVKGSPLPDVVWIKHPYSEINENTHGIHFDNHNYTLIINNTEVQHSGNYSCIMTNKVGATEVIFDVTILKPPAFLDGRWNNATETHIVALRRSLVLKCLGDGNPLPKITWLKDTQPLSASATNVQQVLGGSILTIWTAGPSDGGHYVCILANSAGSAHRRYHVSVKVPGKWSPWSSWSYCNVTCGLGYQNRTRSCQYIDDFDVTHDNTTESQNIIIDESSCKGGTVDRRKCHMPPCEERSVVWSKWSPCSASCGIGTQVRTKRCRNKTDCFGDNVQIRKCPNLPECLSYEISNNVSENGVSGADDEQIDPIEFIPETTYEMVPVPPFDTDAEEVYIEPEKTRSTEYYEVIVTENLDRSERGSCDAGYKFDNATATCEDVDECLIDTNLCHSTQVCMNTAGGYKCSCSKGFIALGIGQRCLDINECEVGTAGCEYACVNTAGAYVCACPRPLRLHTDRHRCVPPNYRDPQYVDTGEDYISTAIEYPTRYKNSRK